MKSVCGMALAVTLFMAPSAANAGSGYYFGAHFGFWDFFEDAGEYADTDGGFLFGPKVGIYFIAQSLALSLDTSIRLGLVGETTDEFFFEAPNIQITVGTGFDGHQIFIGGGFSLFGMDWIGDETNVSILDPYATAGIQIGFAGFVARGEFQLGHTFRFGSEPNYSFRNIAITLGYGLYTEFL